MSQKQPIRHPDKRFTNGLFSAGILCDGWLYLSGAGPLHMASGELVPGTIEEQTTRTLTNLEKVIHEAGGSRDDVIKCTCYLADLEDFVGFNDAFGQFFTDIRPTRTTVQAGLMKQMKVEIDAVAKLS